MWTLLKWLPVAIKKDFALYAKLFRFHRTLYTKICFYDDLYWKTLNKFSILENLKYK